MNLIKKQPGRNFWLAGLLLTSLVAGCSSSDNSDNGSSAGTTPSVSSTSPTDAATAVALNSQVVATFSEAMDAATLTDKSFIVKGEGEDALTGEVSYDKATKTASFTASRNFTAGLGHTATLTTAVTTSTGAPLAADYAWSFTSGAIADLTAPKVTVTDPAAGNVGFSRNRSVTATFDEALDPATLDETTFTLSLSTGGPVIDGAVSYSDRVATFDPTAELLGGTVYTATLTTAITDLAGNALVADATTEWSFTTGTTVAAGPAPVILKTAGDFVILSKSGITNTSGSVITGDIGSSPIGASSMNTITCPQIIGTIYGADDGIVAPDCFVKDAAKLTTAVSDMETAYTDAAGRITPDELNLGAGEIGGLTIVPGLYKWGTNVDISTDVTLNGGANDVWIFQVGDKLNLASDKKILLTGGAVPENIFWQVAGAQVFIGTGAQFEGVILAQAGIDLKTGAKINGRLLSQTAVTLQSNTVTQPAP